MVGLYANRVIKKQILMQEEQKSFSLTQKQEQAIRSKAKYKVLNFGRRSGKTTELAYEALGTAFSIPNAKITYYAQTFGDARDIAWEIFLKAFGGSVIKKNETLLEITVKGPAGISKIFLKGWESVVTAEKGRGTENDLILLDEVAYLRGFKHYWQSVLEPTLLTTKGRAVFGSTPNGFNDFYELSNYAQNHPDWFYLHATSYDNPYNDALWLDQKKNDLPQDVFAQEYLADFRKQEGLVFKEFSRDRHIFDKSSKEIFDISYMGGIDFGFSNPAGIVEIKKDKKGIYNIVGEFYEKGRTDVKLAEIVAAYNFEKVYPDPENAGAIQELRNHNVNVYDVFKGKDSIKAGISKMREMFLRGLIRIDKTCINLIWELETYHYPIKVLGDESELPQHENCRLIDALRYVILMDVPFLEESRSEWDELWKNELSTTPAKLNPAR